jgi:hypothetical protein
MFAGELKRATSIVCLEAMGAATAEPGQQLLAGQPVVSTQTSEPEPPEPADHLSHSAPLSTQTSEPGPADHVSHDDRSAATLPVGPLVYSAKCLMQHWQTIFQVTSQNTWTFTVCPDDLHLRYTAGSGVYVALKLKPCPDQCFPVARPHVSLMHALDFGIAGAASWQQFWRCKLALQVYLGARKVTAQFQVVSGMFAIADHCELFVLALTLQEVAASFHTGSSDSQRVNLLHISFNTVGQETVR